MARRSGTQQARISVGMCVWVCIHIYIYIKTHTHRWLGGLERSERAWIPAGDTGMHWSDIYMEKVAWGEAVLASPSERARVHALHVLRYVCVYVRVDICMSCSLRVCVNVCIVLFAYRV